MVSEQGAAFRRPGRPDYKPTDEQRALVKARKAERASNVVIARELDISPVTLRKYFAAELGVAQKAAAPELDFTKEAPKPLAGEPGRPEHEATESNRQKVRLWALADWSEDRMARQLGISRNTLRKHYAPELEFGADHVATQAMLDLQRQSREGKTAASRRLLEIYSESALPRPNFAGNDDGEPLGKKDQARVDAKTAEQGTGWADLVH
jgi:hypothetical protein